MAVETVRRRPRLGWRVIAALVLLGHAMPLAAQDARSVASAHNRLSTPIVFEANQGHAPSDAAYLARTPGYLALFTAEGPRLFLNDSNQPSFGRELRFEFVGARSPVAPTGRHRLPGNINYFVGNDPSRWSTGIATYGRLEYDGVLPGVDVSYYGAGRQMEYDITLARGIDPDRVRIRVRGADSMTIDETGTLVIRAGGIVLHQPAPLVYQGSTDSRRLLSAEYFLESPDVFGIHVGASNPAEPIVIDPVLVYSTYLGGALDEGAAAVAVDSAGNAYIVGTTRSGSTFPSPPDPPFIAHGGYDVFVVKLGPNGQLLYTTFLVGSSFDGAMSVAATPAGDVFIVGTTNSFDFPITPGSFARPLSGRSSTFVTRLTANGALAFSANLGDTVGDLLKIAIDSVGNPVVAGYTCSSSYPTTPGAYQTTPPGSCPGFVTKLRSDGTDLLFSTFIGGAVEDEVHGLAIDGNGAIYIGGMTNSPDFPTTAGAFRRVFVQGMGFVTKLNSSGSALQYSTFISKGSVVDAIAVDDQGNAYVTGIEQDINFPTTPLAFQTSIAPNLLANGVAFVTKLNPGGTGLLYSTLLAGGAGALALSRGLSIAVDVQGRAHVAGVTGFTNFPVTPDALQIGPSLSASRHGFLSRFDPSASRLEYSTFLHNTVNLSNGDTDVEGLALDAIGNVHVVGSTFGSGFPTANAVQPLPGSPVWPDGYALKLFLGTPVGGPTPLSIVPTRGGAGGFVTVAVTAAHLIDGARVELRQGGSTIVGARLRVSAAEGTLTARFALPSQASGLWDVVVINPDGQTATLAGAFLVEPARHSHVTIDVVGAPAIRIGSSRRYFVTYTNTGNVDAEYVPIWIRLPSNVSGEVAMPLNPPSDPTIDWSAVPTQLQAANGDILIPLLITRISPLTVGVIPIDVKGASGNSFEIKAWSTPGFTERTAGDELTLVASAIGCSAAFTDLSVKAADALIGTILPIDCAAATRILVTEWALSLFKAEADAIAQPDQSTRSLLQFSAKFIMDAARACLACFEDLNVEIKFAKKIGTAVALTYAVWETIEACHEASRVADGFEHSLSVQLLSSKDPNDKSGQSGSGPHRYIDGHAPMTYAIAFENLETANAPAQTVVVQDQLDVAVLDPNSVTFGLVSVGTRILTPPPGAKSLHTTVDLRPERNLLLRVNASVDVATGLIVWRFESLDPATGLPTTDPFAGFLPPNHTAPEGQGTALFSATPYPALVTDTQITNSARITFDNNPDILTPPWTNTLDRSTPQSHVLALPAVSPQAFLVRWQGSDPGAGVASFRVFVSDNGAAFTEWLSDVSATQAIYTGLPGHTYSFFSTATDFVGLTEDAKTAAEATTEVATDTIPPVTTATPSSAPNAFGWYRSNITVTLAAVDNPGGSGVQQIAYRETGAQTLPLTTVSSALVSLPIVADGTTRIDFFATDNAGNVEPTGQLTVRLDAKPPEAFEAIDAAAADIAVFGRDDLSGVNGGPFAPVTVVRVKWNRDDVEPDDQDEVTGDAELRTYRVFDLAGSFVELNEKVKRGPRKLNLRALSAAYSGGSSVFTSDIRASFHWDVAADGSLKNLDQSITIASGRTRESIKAHFDAKRNTTTIVSDGPGPKSEVSRPGLVLLRIVTNRGTFSVESP